MTDAPRPGTPPASPGPVGPSAPPAPSVAGGAGEPDGTAPPRPTLPRGCRLALDVGTVRIGVARSDPDGILATPFDTVRREQRADVRRIAAMVRDEAVACVYVGLPRTLRGGDSSSTTLAREVADELARAVRPVPVHLVDERLSTVDASRMMRDSGRRAREQRAAIDSAAAVVILQTALDTEHATGERAGLPVAVPPAPRPGPRPGSRPGPAPRPGPPPATRPAPATGTAAGADPGPSAAASPDAASVSLSESPGASGSVTPGPGAPRRKPRHRRSSGDPGQA